ncbi:MAG: cadherin repeat domain-containing protein, partial [Gammaproteobacteria bacterium]|nr:cadherin repeat domain-containing protein [Gammaproteobacteria bacterium]
MKNIVKIDAQQKTMQVKAEKIVATLDKQVIVITDGIQHIQTKSGVAYELGIQDGKFFTQDVSLIAKKVSNDLEIALESGVVIFDDYFEICTINSPCLVSFSVEEDGLYHVVIDTFILLEDDTQLVYFYGDQSIVFNESSAVYNTDSPIFSAPLASALLILGIATIHSSSADDNTATTTTITGFFSAGKYVSGGIDAVEVFKADGSGDKLGTGSLSEDGSYTITLAGNYAGAVYIKLAGTVMHKDEVSDSNREIGADLHAIAVIDSGANVVNINVQTTIAFKVAGGSITNALNKTAVDNANKSTQEALKLDKNILTTRIDTINSQGDEDGSKYAGYMGAALSGYAGGFATASEEIAHEIKNYGALSATSANKLIAGIMAVNETINNQVIAITSDVASKKNAVENAQTADEIASAEKAYKVAVEKLAEYKVYALAIKDAITGDFMVDLKANTVDTTDPVFSSPTASANVSTKAAVTTVVYDANATDNNGANDVGITYSITDGANKDLFEFKDATAAAAGKLTYKNIQTAESDHVVIITATDTAGNTATQTVTIHTKDFFSSIEWNGATTDDYINSSEKSDVTLSGKITGGSNTVVIEKIEILKGNIVEATIAQDKITITGKDWILTNAGKAIVTALTDGTYTAKVTIKDAPTTSESKPITYETSSPTINNIEFTSNPGTDKTYKAGDVVEITATMSENTIVTGTPKIALLSGKYATYASGTGSKVLIFKYTIATGDTDANGLDIAANALSLSGGTLADAVGNNAILAHDAINNDTNHRVDAIVPVFSSPTASANVSTKAAVT